MDAPEIAAIVRKVRRLEVAIASLLLLLGVMFLSAQIGGPRQVVEAREFRMVDERGILRAKLASAETDRGGTTFILYDAYGERRFSVGVSDVLQFLLLQGEKDGVRIGAGPVALPQVHFTDASGRVRLAFEVHGAGPLMTMQDHEGNRRVAIGISENTPGVLLLDESGRVVEGLAVP